MLRSYNKHQSTKRFQAEGDKFEDTHTWVVMDGKIIDPTPMSDANEWAIYFLKLEKTPTYIAHDDETQKLFTEELIYRIVLEEKARGKYHDHYKEPRYGQCYYNAWAFKKHNPTAKLVFGSVGYKFKSGSGKKQRKTATPKYFVCYGTMLGQVVNDDYVLKAVKHARTTKDQHLLRLILNFHTAHTNRNDDDNWGFTYKIRSDGTSYGEYTQLDDDA